jgi:hypothetical protein
MTLLPERKVRAVLSFTVRTVRSENKTSRLRCLAGPKQLPKEKRMSTVRTTFALVLHGEGETSCFVLAF